MIEFFNFAFPFLQNGLGVFVPIFFSFLQQNGNRKLLPRVFLTLAIYFCVAVLFSLIAFFLSLDFLSRSYLQILYFTIACGLTLGVSFYSNGKYSDYFAFNFAISLFGVFLINALTSVINYALQQVTFFAETAVQYVVWLICFITVYAFLYFIFFRKPKSNLTVNLKIFLKPFLSVAFFISVIISVIRIYVYALETTSLVFFEFCNVCYAIIILIVAYAFLAQEKVEEELDFVKRLWKEDRRNYELQKETIDIINIKCHDFRHQLQNVRKSGNVTEKAIQDVEKSIDIYNSFVKTNNEVLDVILSNYSLRCQKNGTLLSCAFMAEGLDFMDEMDVYSLFGNMLENALEYEQKVFPKEKRFISISGKPYKGFISILVCNYYQDEANLSNGVMLTTKADKNYHGFGIKSMKRIVEKYNGNLTIVIEDNMFQVQILFPVQNKNTKDEDGER